MTRPDLYRGMWPQNVNRLAKFAVRFVDRAWTVTVLYEAAAGLQYLAVEGAGAELAGRINAVKTALQDQPGGAFYINEYRHVLVPVADTSGSGPGSYYYEAGRLDADLDFEFEGRPLTTRPITPAGVPLKPGDRWEGPRPGIPYVLAAGGGDIYYETPALTDDDPPRVLPMMTRKVQLSKVLGDRAAVARAARPVAEVRGQQGGRFYVNEHGAMFTPVDAGDGNGLDFLYCGQIDRAAWFPEPRLRSQGS
jgi:hypothetical protein